MTYRYVLKYRRLPVEEVAVEAWPSDPRLALDGERRKPSFTIGKLEGPRTFLLMSTVHDLAKRYGYRRYGRVTHVRIPNSDISGVADAYRVGLAAAALSFINSEESAENAYRYIMRATEEEIWFWVSKYLGVVGDGVKVEKVVEALCVISSS